ncbi:unnamed protein product, partial [Trichobilharzia regenti]
AATTTDNNQHKWEEPERNNLLYLPGKHRFHYRPIWMRPALAYHMPADTRLVYFTQILPSLAYYMVRGPWSRAWVRYGYDPRKDPEARYYQVCVYYLY